MLNSSYNWEGCVLTFQLFQISESETSNGCNCFRKLLQFAADSESKRMYILLLRRIVQKSRKKMWAEAWDEYAWQKPCHWSQPGHQCYKERASKVAPELPPLPYACRRTPWHSLVSWAWYYLFPPDDHHGVLKYAELDLDWVILYLHPLLHPGDLPGVLYWVGLDLHLLLHAG